VNPGRKVVAVQLWRTFDEIVIPDGGTSVALGVFDGLHRGHRGLVDHAVGSARDLGASPVLVTFDPHPVEVIRPGTHPLVLTPLERRAELAGEFGMDAVFALPFDAGMASWEPDEFVDRVLVEGLGSRSVTVGSNFTFGRRAAGTPGVMRELCADRGIEVRVVDLLESDGEPISSSRIRRLISDADVAGAATILGRPHRVSGVVVHGAGRGGRDLGYPTANLDLPEYTAIPVDGVYAGWFTLLDDHPVDGTIVPGRRYPAAISVGTNPTFGDAVRSVEAFVLDESADLYGRVAAVDFVDHVRDMEKFTSVDELLVAMDRDVARTRTVLAADGADA
jgi:riboflavin kinase/FMN adenylyltransferase